MIQLLKIIYIFLDLLNGYMALQQTNEYINTNYVSVAYPVSHEIKLDSSDNYFLKNMSYLNIYWFLDCEYLDQTDSVYFVNTYTDITKDYNILALMVASSSPVSINSWDIKRV